MPQHIAAEVTEADKPPDVPRLTRNGYERSERGQADILACLGLDGKALVDAFREERENAPDYRCAEAMIFFIRRALSRNETRVVAGLFELLRSRCRGYFRGAMRGLRDEEERVEAQDIVLEHMTSLLLRDDDASDFLQAKFWLYLKRRSLSALQQVVKRRRKEHLLDDFSVGDQEEDGSARIERVAGAELSPEGELILREAIAQLPAPLQETYVLRRIGWRVGDEGEAPTDTLEPTLAERFGVTPRAIRKRLDKAEQILRRYWKDEA